MPQAVIALGANEPWSMEGTPWPPTGGHSQPSEPRQLNEPRQPSEPQQPSDLWQSAEQMRLGDGLGLGTPSRSDDRSLSAERSAVPFAFRRLAVNLDRAVARLSATPGIRVLACSRWQATAAAGGPAGQPAFLNGALRIETDWEPLALLDHLQAIEREGGRERRVHWGPRTIDLDLLLYGRLVLDTPRLVLPHPRLGYRRFVLEPAAEIASDWPHPLIGWTIGQLARHIASPLNLVAVLGRDRAAIAALIEAVLLRVPGDYLRDPIPVPGAGENANRDHAHPIAMLNDLEFARRGRLVGADRAATPASRTVLSDFRPAQALDWGAPPSPAELPPAGRSLAGAGALPTPKLWVGMIGRSDFGRAAGAIDDSAEDARWLTCLTRPGRGPWLMLDATAFDRSVAELIGAIESF